MKIGPCIVVLWLTAIITSLLPPIYADCHAPTDLIITKRTGAITTSNGGGQYNDNQDCVWQFRNHEDWNVARIVLGATIYKNQRRKNVQKIFSLLMIFDIAERKPEVLASYLLKLIQTLHHNASLIP